MAAMDRASRLDDERGAGGSTASVQSRTLGRVYVLASLLIAWPVPLVAALIVRPARDTAQRAF